MFRCDAVIVMSQSEIMLERLSNLDNVREVIARALGIDLGRIPATSTRLFGSLPELDSFGVVELVAALEKSFGFIVDDSDFSADIFATVGTLASFVERKRNQTPGHKEPFILQERFG